MQPLQFRFRYSEAEYLNASRLLLVRDRKMIGRLVAFIPLFLCISLLLTILLPNLAFPFWLALPISLLFAAVFVYRIFTDMPRRFFRGDAKLRDEFLLTFSHDGVWVKTSLIDSKLAWSLYTQVFENDSTYVIVYGKDARMMTVVPKRVFQSANEELEFRRLLREHVDHKLPPTNAKLEAQAQHYVPSGPPPDWRKLKTKINDELRLKVSSFLK